VIKFFLIGHDVLVFTSATGFSVATTVIGGGVVVFGIATLPANPVAGAALIYGGLVTAGGGIAATAVMGDAAVGAASEAIGAGGHH